MGNCRHQQDQTLESQRLLFQSIAELKRGLVVLESDLRVHARINTARGKHEISSTLNALHALVHMLDTLTPTALRPTPNKPSRSQPTTERTP